LSDEAKRVLILYSDNQYYYFDVWVSFHDLFDSLTDPLPDKLCNVMIDARFFNK